MKNLICISLTSILVLLFTTGISYAAFPIKNIKTATTTVASESSSDVRANTIVQNKAVRQTSFLYRISHPADSIYGLFSLLSLVFGAIGLIVAFFTAAGFALGLAAVVLGAIGLYMGSEKMMATLGIILGIVAIIVALIA